jgi:hypothetical protein
LAAGSPTRFSRVRRRIAGLAEHAHHHAAIVTRPDRAIGRERIGPVALVAVDGRCGERRGGVRVRQQATKEVQPELRQSLTRVAYEGIALVTV